MAGEEVIPGDWMPTTFIKPFVLVFSIIKSPVDEAGRRPVKDLINSLRFITSSSVSYTHLFLVFLEKLVT